MAEFLKMNTLLAKVEHATASVARLFSDYANFFKNKQGMFRGYKKTFTPRDGYFEDPSKMGTSVVTTTVDEKFDWFNIQFKNWLKDVFKQRKNKYRRYRDLSFFILIGVYALSVIDAYVDASLSDFDISPDLSMRIEPAVMNSGMSQNPLKAAAIGLNCSLTF